MSAYLFSDTEIARLAEILFASPLQPSDNPTSDEVRAAVDHAIRVCGDAQCLACVAQEAGDHPESYAARMQWALGEVGRAYSIFPFNLAAAA
jgi:hypothetical protein